VGAGRAIGPFPAGTRAGTYGEFAEAAAKVKLDKEDKEPEINNASTSRIRSTAALNTLIDTRLPAMVYAGVKASPDNAGK